jgi:hypothetical protein
MKGPKGRKVEKYYFKVKAPRVKERPFRQDATEPWEYLADKLEDLRVWITACEEYFQRNTWQWELDTDHIKYVIGRFKKPSRAQDFDTQYCREMDSTDGFIMRPAHLYWVTFVSAIKNRFLSSLEGQEAKNQMDAEKYSGDIEDYIVKMKRLNNLVGMSGVTLRTTIERQLPKDLRRRIFLMPSTDLDDEWIQTVVKAGKMEESFLAEEKLLRGSTEKPQVRKSNPAKGKERATSSSSKGRGAWNQGLIQRFEKPKDWKNLTHTEKEERSKRLRGIPLELLQQQKNQGVCQRCGEKGHTQ